MVGSADQFRPVVDGGATFPAGFSAGAVYAGIKTPGPGKLDLAILASDRPAVAAGIFTTNAFCAAPVVVSRERVARARARAVIANAGNANACTGEQGLADANEMAALAARKIDGGPEDVLVASTGVPTVAKSQNQAASPGAIPMHPWLPGIPNVAGRRQ